MIALLSGRVASRGGGAVVVDVHGVGYRVFVSAPMEGRLKPGEEVRLHVHTHVREDALQLFGFEDTTQRDVFLSLNKVKGIGPKLAMAVLGSVTTDELLSAVSSGDVKRLTHIPGLGKKTAERILVELQEAFQQISPTGAGGAVAAAAGDRFADVASALANLGYKPAQIDGVIGKMKNDPDLSDDFESLFREAMRRMK